MAVVMRGDPQEGGTQPTPYEKWVRQQGIPIIEGYGVPDLTAEKFGYWDRLGANAYFVIMRGHEGLSGLYVAEIPPGGSTNREHHLYEKLIYVLEGTGSTTVEGPNGEVHQFEWGPNSMFAIPLNSPHRHYAHGAQVRFAAFTLAPLAFDLYYDEDFIYDTPHAFRTRFNGQEGFFHQDVRHEYQGDSLFGAASQRLWETNFVHDVKGVMEASEAQASGLRFIKFEPADNTLIAHLSKYPPTRYMQGHYHAGGAVLLIIRSHGYSLMWPNTLGEHPFESGFGDQVVRFDWKVGSVFSPPTGWFHQHFNLGSEPALQLAVRHGSTKHPFGPWVAVTRNEAKTLVTSSREGGTMIRYEDEDPAIKRMFEESLSREAASPAPA
jgi:quercetin dioxygenase-like cupin family protein